MSALFLAAVGAGFLASWVHALQWGVPFSLLPLRTILRDWIGVGFFALLFGLIARLGARLADAEAVNVDLIGASAALVGGLAWSWLVGRNGRLLRGLLILCSAFLQSETRELAERALEKWLDKNRQKNKDIYQHAAILAVTSFCHVGEWNKALSLITTIDEQTLPEEVRKVYQQSRERCERELRLDKPVTELRL